MKHEIEAMPKPGPTANRRSEEWWRASGDGRLLLQRCESCSGVQFYPRVICAVCWSDSLTWFEAAGTGRVWTLTVVSMPGHPAWKTSVPYALAIIELDEGPRLLSNVVHVDPQDVRVGDRVRAVVTREHGQQSMIRFEPTQP